MLTGTYRDEGVYQNMAIETYHGDTNSISRSGIMTFDESPYRYWAQYLNPDRPKKEPTEAMIFGNAFHTLILEAPEFGKRFAMLPEKKLLKDVGRDEYERYKAEVAAIEASSKPILSPEQFETLLNMQIALYRHPEAKELIEGAIYEQSYFWPDKGSGLMVKARPDILHPQMIVDLKTCADASPRGFQRAMVAGGYHMQGAMIQDAVQALEGRWIPNVINIAVEKTYPYSVGIYIIDEEALDAGRRKYKEILVDIKSHIGHTEPWPDYPIQTISLPSWA